VPAHPIIPPVDHDVTRQAERHTVSKRAVASTGVGYYMMGVPLLGEQTPAPLAVAVRAQEQSPPL